MVEQVIRTAALWLLGSRNPAVDCTRLQERRPLLEPVRPQNPPIASSSALGRSFEDRFISEVLPVVASKLGVSPVSRLYRLTRHVAHSGDLAIHYRDRVGMIELKNHGRALPVVDRRRFFESILVNYRQVDWAILVTSRCSVPHFGERGYTVVGSLAVDLGAVQKLLPVAFVCGLDTLGPRALEAAIRAVISPPDPLWTRWSVSDLLTRGEISRASESLWGTADGSIFRHPPGAVFS